LTNSSKCDNETSIFIIGSGPSLNLYDMTRLRSHNTFSMNRQYISYEEWGFLPTYYGCIDRNLLPTIADDIGRMIDNNLNTFPIRTKNFFLAGDFAVKTWEAEDIDAGVLLPNTYTRFLREQELEKLKTYVKEKGRVGENKIYVRASQINSPQIDVSHGGGGTISIGDTLKTISGESWSSCGLFCTNVAAAIGYENIYLLGMDVKYYGDESLDHYDPRYFDPASGFQICKTHGNIATEEQAIIAWKDFSTLVSSQESYQKPPNIISCTPRSPINDLFPFKPFEEVIENIKTSTEEKP